MGKPITGAEIRQSYIEFFLERGHTFVHSSSLVPGGDQTLLFTNAGMVQFKDVFLGTDQRGYKRAANSQKCMRVAGKHNDLDDVGRDDTHHTLFEMLGNWSFGDYYKKEAISWAWELLTQVWGLDGKHLWATCFRDENNAIPTDEEAAACWRQQPGMQPERVLYFGRKENFWEMAETGPCGPCSEIHMDLGVEFCNKKGEPGHVCQVNGDCRRFVELWNLVFIQYNRSGPENLEPLPATHVDTGMGLERVVSVIQGVYSNYRTDLLMPLMETVREMTGHTHEERDADITPYRVIADHGRAAAFLIADGVVPGNTGRNYVCRMIIRRAARFGSLIGLEQPFLARVADTVITNYGDFYPELRRNRTAILANLTREEERFRRTLEEGVSRLDELLMEVKASGQNVLNGNEAFELYATHGLPLEITRDIAREQGLDVEEAGFRLAMEEHRMVSGAGKAFGPLGGEDVEIYREILSTILQTGKLNANEIGYDPYDHLEVNGEVLALLKDGVAVNQVNEGDYVEVILPKTCFYIEAGGQVSDQGLIYASGESAWKISITDMRRPAAGMIVHIGKVVCGTPKVGDEAVARVDAQRRRDIMRNHTATHLLHAQLQKVLGEHARQAGSLVAPDRLRFDFTHQQAMTGQELENVEAGVNQEILADFALSIRTRTLSEAMAEGAMALFGEKYGEQVRTVTIGGEERISFELCGGTHVEETADIGLFVIVSEGSAAAGVRRIEAVTGRAAYEVIHKRMSALKRAGTLLNSSPEEVPDRVEVLSNEIESMRKQNQRMHEEIIAVEFKGKMENVPLVSGIPVLVAVLPQTDADTMRQMADRYRQKFPSSVLVLGSEIEGKPLVIAAVTEDLINRGLHAGELVREVAQVLGGSGGGRPTLAQAGGKDASKLKDALERVLPLIEAKLK